MNTTLTALEGFRVGHWTDAEARTGCTVLLAPPQGWVASGAFLGPAPGTRETALLAPEKTVGRAHALLLTGGSAFGLAAADGVMRYLEEQGVGFETGFARVPIVPAAVIYDLGVGDARVRPTAESGYLAAQAASSAPVELGRVGAGTGATVGKYLGLEHAAVGGLGSALVEQGGVRVGALAVVNAVGDVYAPSGELLAGPGRFPGARGWGLQAGTNTTLIAVGLEAAVSKAEARALADAAQAALARVVRPSHTPFDGDAAFVLSSEVAGRADPLLLTALVQEAVARAVVSAVR
ncbi:L-aminopeptidase/D-esterase-like protein [Deinobacterium chartae]|uniref:L-aminopeptidase/D-esterase-like protein n=1 Tax=Deinobacterium chartae TaxID=521158 RepID=A0A841HZE7_9DEIO|nr:P1 family peptidase [Deinobacterium chartae]MBB6098313.1 L-aminopeptidase/D-esterase-like protein [Deinobacterium chartae]